MILLQIIYIELLQVGDDIQSLLQMHLTIAVMHLFSLM